VSREEDAKEEEEEEEAEAEAEEEEEEERRRWEEREREEERERWRLVLGVLWSSYPLPVLLRRPGGGAIVAGLGLLARVCGACGVMGWYLWGRDERGELAEKGSQSWGMRNKCATPYISHGLLSVSIVLLFLLCVLHMWWVVKWEAKKKEKS
jgi:hypothetical protein